MNTHFVSGTVYRGQLKPNFYGVPDGPNSAPYVHVRLMFRDVVLSGGQSLAVVHSGEGNKQFNLRTNDGR